MYDSGAILDSGELYLTYAIQPQDSSEYFKQTYLTKFEPLEIDLNFDAENYSPGDEVTITVNSNLIPTSAFANSDNQIQIVTDWGGRIVLEYVGGEAGAQTWQGSFVIPEDLEPGSYGLSLQVSIFGIEGGAETDFAQPLPNTNGQGYVSNFNIEVTDASLVETGENIMKTIGIFLALGLGLQMIFSKSRKPFNIRKFHQRR
jgi:hypothetical protein